VVFLTFIVAGNVAYIWLKKEPQFRARSAPTKELVDFLNALDGSSLNTSGIRVCGFPLPSWYGQLAIAGFTEFDAGRVAFVDHCDETANSISLNWDDDTGRYRQVVPD
jgi:hypothetical protein